jgi:hypothetical protein
VLSAGNARVVVRTNMGSAPRHCTWMSHLIHEYLAKDNATVLLQLPYSSDMVPANHYPFSQLKELLNRWRFASSDYSEAATTAGLNKVTKNGLQDWFQQSGRDGRLGSRSQGHHPITVRPISCRPLVHCL